MCVVENTIDELKTHLLGRKTPIRSLKPRQVVQEIYGWLLGHCPKALLDVPSRRAGRNCYESASVSLVHLTSNARAIPQFQQAQPSELPFFGLG